MSRVLSALLAGAAVVAATSCSDGSSQVCDVANTNLSNGQSVQRRITVAVRDAEPVAINGRLYVLSGRSLTPGKHDLELSRTAEGGLQARVDSNLFALHGSGCDSVGGIGQGH